MRIIIEPLVATVKSHFFASPFKTFTAQNLATKKITIPVQQRGYDWPKETSINDLLDDLDQHLLSLPQGHDPIPQDPETTSNYYYSGTILCEDQQNETLKLIDGQQRITTLYLLNFTAYLLSKLRFHTIPPMDDRRYQRELTNRFNTFLKWEARCFIKKNLTDDMAALVDTDSILTRIGDTRNAPMINYWPFLEPRLAFADTAVNSPKFQEVIHRTELQPINGKLTFNQIRDNTYSLGINKIIKHLNDKIEAPTPYIDTSISMMLNYIEYYISHLAMTCIISECEDDSFTLFEILNERGKDVTALDLLKNLIFERDQIPGPPTIQDFAVRWDGIMKRVESFGKKGKAASNFVEFLIRSEGKVTQKKQISYLRTNIEELDLRYAIFCRESISNFFFRLQKCSEIIEEIHKNSKQDNNHNLSPFDNYRNTCFQYTTFMRMMKYDWGQQVIIGSNILHLISNNYGPASSLNDTNTNNWKQTNSNPANPNLSHFQRFLGDILLKIGLIGVVNKLSSNKLPDCSKAILDNIIRHTIRYGAECATPDNLRALINEIIALSLSIINDDQKTQFKNRLISDFSADTAPSKNVAKIILYLIYTRTRPLQFTCPHLEHFEPIREGNMEPPYYNKGDRSIMVNRLGNFFLIDANINQAFQNQPIIEKLRLAREQFPNNAIIQTELFQNVDFTRNPLVEYDQVHGPLPKIKMAITDPPDAEDSFELNGSPTNVFFDRRTKLMAELATNYIFSNSTFIHTNLPY